MAAARKVWSTICWQPDYFKQGNYAKAYQRMESAAETGNARAMHALGTMLDNGQGCAQDSKKALYWYEKAAKKNHPDAQFYCGWDYHEGICCAVDYDRAFLWLGKAAEQNHADAQFRWMVTAPVSGCPMGQSAQVELTIDNAYEDIAQIRVFVMAADGHLTPLSQTAVLSAKG